MLTNMLITRPCTMQMLTNKGNTRSYTITNKANRISTSSLMSSVYLCSKSNNKFISINSSSSCLIYLTSLGSSSFNIVFSIKIVLLLIRCQVRLVGSTIQGSVNYFSDVTRYLVAIARFGIRLINLTSKMKVNYNGCRFKIIRRC